MIETDPLVAEAFEQALIAAEQSGYERALREHGGEELFQAIAATRAIDLELTLEIPLVLEDSISLQARWTSAWGHSIEVLGIAGIPIRAFSARTLADAIRTATARAHEKRREGKR